MDNELRAAWRRYLSTGTLEDYFHYLELTIRAHQTPECAVNMVPCPHCLIATHLHDDVDLWNLAELFYNNFKKTPTGSFAAMQHGPGEVMPSVLGDTLYWVALVFLVTFFDSATLLEPESGERRWSLYPANFKIGQCLLANELVYGPSLEEGDYGYDENWPSDEWVKDHPPDVAGCLFSLGKMLVIIQNLFNNAAAFNIEIEIVPLGVKSIRPELGPFNKNPNMLPFVRLTFLDDAGLPTFDHETLFLFGPTFTALFAQGEEYDSYIRKHNFKG